MSHLQEPQESRTGGKRSESSDSGYSDCKPPIDWKMESFARKHWGAIKTDAEGFHESMIGFCHLAWFKDPAKQVIGRWGPFMPLEFLVKLLANNDKFGGLSSQAKYLELLEPVDAGSLGLLAHVNITKDVQPLSKTVRVLRASVEMKNVRVGIMVSDLVTRGRHLTNEGELYAGQLLDKTNAFVEDASVNYHTLGDHMEQVHASGGLLKIGETQLFNITQGVVSRWATARESVVAAKLAVKLVFSKPDERWSPALFEEAMEEEMSETQRQSRLLSMAGMVFKDKVGAALENRRRREIFTSWKADALAPAKAFCRVVGVSDAEVDAAADRAITNSVSMASWAVAVVKTSAYPVTKIMFMYASGLLAGSALFAAAGILMDIYYEDVETQKLGPERRTENNSTGRNNHVNRVREYLAIGAAQADENYDVSTHTQVIRADPFFFSLVKDVSRMKEDSAAQRMVTNAILTPLIQTVSTTNKSIINLPGSISEESARHLQEALPDFYFRIVNRSHSHPETWAVRRAFEIIVSRNISRSDDVSKVIMIGGNVRQVSKIPGIVANFGPILTGRDEARKRQSGTVVQRALYQRLNINERFGENPLRVDDALACAFYSTQGMSKSSFAKACIASGIFKAYIAMNIPVVMMDDRIDIWDDEILRCRYHRKGRKLYMSCLNVPVPGYTDDAEHVMSWVKPIEPILGYSVELDTLVKVGSSYLFELRIGVGPQEEYETTWAMPDAGHYVLHDLTRDNDDVKHFTVPAQKFNQTVKYIVQLNGAKNVVESAAGRMLGLEAQIKIGNVVLERAWHTDTRQFVSTLVHAIMCAGLGKSDALLMMSKMRSHFSAASERSLVERVLNGYSKLFSLQRDERLPGKAKRGASDYDVVTHWTTVQNPGVGFAEPVGSGDGTKFRGSSKFSDKTEPFVDEGYCSADSLNTEDAVNNDPDVLPEDVESNPLSQLNASVRWTDAIFGTRNKQAKVGDYFPGWKPNTRRMTLSMDKSSVEQLMSSSKFDPMGLPNFGDSSGSLANVEFVSKHSSLEDILKTLESGPISFPAPDSGAVTIVKMAIERERTTTALCAGFCKPVNFKATDDGAIEQLQEKFFSEVTDGDSIVVPSILIDGLAGSAKSAVVSSTVKEYQISCAVVCPTRTLAFDWRKKKVGTVVTRHKLMTTTLKGRSLLVIDECYAYTKAEMYAYLWKAAQSECKVLLLGDRRQQYEDGGEITASDFNTLKTPVMRMCVSNTMPVDSTYIAAWAGQEDPFVSMFQTRSKVVHSICFSQKDTAEDVEELKVAVNSDDCLLYKDKAEPLLQYVEMTDEELGFLKGGEQSWLSTSRVQGKRTDHAVLLSGRFNAMEKWYVQQPGLFYVATSRHSKSQLIWGDQFDLNLLIGLKFEHKLTVDGRLALIDARERIGATMTEQVAKAYKHSPILERLYQSGALPQVQRFRSAGAILEDWRPWHKFSLSSTGHSRDIFKATTDRLVGVEQPYVMTDAVKYPVYQSAQGLTSVRRPENYVSDQLNTDFTGLSRLAILQHSRDELLDQKNVIERTARPRVIDEDPWRIRAQANTLFNAFKEAFLVSEATESLSLQPSVFDWSNTRTSEFVSKMLLADHYGTTAFSVRSAGFLKTQTKVKLKRSFALEENYGQTVLASPADFNAKFGEWSKMFLRNLRLCTRRGVIMDSGYSDKEVARELRRCHVLGRFQDENYQADVKRQDTSHTPVTLRVFCMLMSEMGVPQELCDLYELHSKRYAYASMHSGLYRGEARYNLGSGDPFTLVRNIVEVLTVMLERFGDQLCDANMIIKGDDFLCDKIMTILPEAVPEIRQTQLTEDYNKPPYHAGRFFLPDDVVPDPVRMVAKILVKRTDNVQRANQLSESFYDRYVHLSDYSYNRLRLFCREAYSDFEPEFSDSAIELYHAMRDRNTFFDLLLDHCKEVSDDDKKLVVLDKENDCAVFAANFFVKDGDMLSSLRDEPLEIIQHFLNKWHVPNYLITGRQNDFLKRGVWLSEEHAWAVIGLTEFNEIKDKIEGEWNSQEIKQLQSKITATN